MTTATRKINMALAVLTAALAVFATTVVLGADSSQAATVVDTRSYTRVGQCMDALWAAGVRRQSVIIDRCDQYWPHNQDWIIDPSGWPTD